MLCTFALPGNYRAPSFLKRVMNHYSLISYSFLRLWYEDEVRMGDETQMLTGKVGLRVPPISTLPSLSISAAPCCVPRGPVHGPSAPLGCVSLRTQCFDTSFHVKGRAQAKSWFPYLLPFLSQRRAENGQQLRSISAVPFILLLRNISCTTHVPAVCWNVLQLHRAQGQQWETGCIHFCCPVTRDEWVMTIPGIRGSWRTLASCFIDCHAE